MKKVIFLLLAVGFTAFGIYSCQKDNKEAVQELTPNAAASNRADFTDCANCAEDCVDCCLKLECTSGACSFYFTNPATGQVTYRTFSAPGTKYVCAAGGWVGVFGSGAGTLTVCSTGESMSKTAGGANNQKQLTWDCDILQ